MAIPVARYMAPELLNPRQFGRMHSTPSKESDVHSFAMTAYEVCHSSRLTARVTVTKVRLLMARSSRGSCRMVCGQRVLPP